MEIRPTQASPVSTASAHAGAARPQADEQPKDSWISSDGGPIRLIIQHEDQQKLEELKKAILAKNPQNHVTAELPIINGFAVELAPDAEGVLPELTKVAGDVRIHRDDEMSIPEGETQDVGPLLDNASPTLGVDKLWAKGITGKDVVVAVIDTGIAQHPDVKDRIIGFQDMVNGKTEAYDDQGHGTHCAGIVAGNGTASAGKYKGVAPEAKLVGVKVLDSRGSGTFSNVIKGIQWAVDNAQQFGIKVISMSLGGRASQGYKDDPVAQAVEAAVKAGITPVIAAGNEGPSAGTIGTPAIAEHVVTVGALDDKGTLDRADDAIASFSSRGPSKYDKLDKPDILAPGVNITSLSNTGDGYRSMSGTSMATPYMAGVAALMVQARPEITPEQLKQLAIKTADKLTPPGPQPIGGTPAKGFEHTQQGAGVIDPVETVEYLLSLNPPKPAPPKPAPPTA